MRYQILGLFCTAAAIAYVQRAALSVPAAEIAADLKFDDLARDMGYVQSAWYLGYALMQLPSGWVADRLGSRSAAAIWCLLWSSCMVLAATAQGWWSLLLLWGAMGSCQAGIFPSAAKAIGQTFLNTEKARASGLLASGMQVGSALSPFVTATLLEALVPMSDWSETFRWRFLLALYALPGILWVAVFLALVPRSELPASPAKTSPGDEVNWWRLASSLPLWLLCTQQFFRAGAMVFFMTWFPTYLQKTRNMSALESGTFATVAGIGGILGSLTGGFFSDWLLRFSGSRRLARQGIAIGGMLACASLVLASYFISDMRIAIAVIALGVYCASFGGVSGYTVAIELGGKQVATVFSLMNMCGNLGSTAFPITAGLLVAATGSWDFMLFFFAGVMVAGACCWALLNPPDRPIGVADEPS